MTHDGWRTVKLGDVARQVSIHTQDPLAEGFTRYVGLDHLDPEHLRVERWGDVSDGTTFTKRFEPGQLLFARRRAYQRKAAIADFAGVCSGDIIVIEADVKHLLPELLPYIVHSAPFLELALKTSAGSLSPRTKWNDLRSYEIRLPPPHFQYRLSELATRLEDGEIQSSRAIRATELARAAAVEEQFKRWQSDSTVPLRTIGEVVKKTQYGLNEPPSETGGFRVLRMNNLDGGVVTTDDMKYVNLPRTRVAQYLLAPGDVLFNRTNSFDLVGKTALFQQQGEYVFASYLIRIVTDSSILLPETLNAFLNRRAVQQELRRFATKGVSQANINPTNLRKVRIPVAPLASQRHFTASLTATDRLIETAARHRDYLSGLREQLISRHFEVTGVNP